MEKDEGKGPRGTYIVIILLHSDHPRDIIERHRAKPEVRVIRNLADFFHKGIKVRRRGSIYRSDEVRRCKAVLV